MPYASSDKHRSLTEGRVPDPAVEALSAASMAASGPSSTGDGTAATSLVPTPSAVLAAKANRFR